MTHQHDEQPLGSEPSAEAFTKPAPVDRFFTIEDVLEIVRLPELRAEIYLRSDLVAEYEQALADLLPLVDADGNVLVDEDGAVGEETPASRAQALATRLDELKEQMRKATWRPLFRGLDSAELIRFQEQHYPKEQGASLSGYYDQLIARTMVEPKSSVEQVQALRTKFPAQEFAKLVEAALKVSTQRIDVPKLPSFSAVLPSQ